MKVCSSSTNSMSWRGHLGVATRATVQGPTHEGVPAMGDSSFYTYGSRPPIWHPPRTPRVAKAISFCHYMETKLNSTDCLDRILIHHMVYDGYSCKNMISYNKLYAYCFPHSHHLAFTRNVTNVVLALDIYISTTRNKNTAINTEHRLVRA